MCFGTHASGTTAKNQLIHRQKEPKLRPSRAAMMSKQEMTCSAFLRTGKFPAQQSR